MKINSRYYLLISIIYIIVVILVNPNGEFPFGDDFAYTGPVKHMIDTGELKITDWSSMTLVGQIIIGWFVCSVFGFSYTNLRLITLFFGLLATLGIFRLSSEFSENKKHSFLAAVTVGFSAPVFMFSFSFVTDISFIALSVWAIIFYLKALKSKSILWFTFAVLINIYALLIRDLGIVLPVGFAIGYLYRYGVNIKKIMTALAPVFIIAVSFFVYQYWFENVHGPTKSMEFSRNKMITVLTSGLGYTFLIYAKNIVYSFLFLGFFLSPILLIRYYELRKKLSKNFRKAIEIILIIGTIVLIAIISNVNKLYIDIRDLIMPHLFIHNIKLADIHSPDYSFVLEYSIVFELLLFAIASAGALILLLTFILFLKDYFAKNSFNLFTKRSGAKELIVIILIAYCFPIFSQILFERYMFLPLILVAVLLCMNSEKQISMIFANSLVVILASFFIFYGVSAARDMMEHNRTRWTALDYLVNTKGILRNTIDGGFEFNAKHFYKWDFPQKEGKNWWWVYDDTYKVTWGRCDGYRTIHEYSYLRFFPPFFQSKIYILKKE